MAGTRRDAEEFAKRWAGRGDENQETQLFWIDLFQNVLGLDDALERLKFEEPVVTDSGSKYAGYIDVLIPSASALVEQKSRGIDLDRPEERQGRMVTPAEQGRGYAVGLPLSRQPRYVVTCNFSTIRVHDRERDALCTGDPLLEIALEDLPKNLAALQFLRGKGEAPASVSRAVSVEAGRIMGEIHDRIAPLYHDPDSEESHHALSVLCTRLMFLMFCEDAGLIEPGLFQRYVAASDAAHLRRALLDLFAWLDTDDGARADEYPDELLARFPYMDGGLFRERVPVPQLDETVRTEILVSGCQEFDWSGVDPTVFGSIFEGALSHDARRAGGMHYTSPENIHKVIDPLFLDDLRTELDGILAERTPAVRTRRLHAYHEKLGSITFLDPACGSGNFLTETYMCLRRLENRVLTELQAAEAARKSKVAEGQTGLDFGDDGTGESPVKVTLANFHGIEINDFACCVARTALWIAEKQADINTEKVIRRVYDPLPLCEYDTIIQGNALRMDWNTVVPTSEVDYIIGNPPFLGAKIMSADQKKEVVDLFGRVKLANSVDYVAAWYIKAAEMMQDNQGIRAAFVSTNSICQGQQVAPVWGTLIDRYGVSIDFARRTYIWDSQADDRAHVHVVIVGFSVGDHSGKVIYCGDEAQPVRHINPYLVDAPDVIVSTAAKPVCPGVPECDYGSLINDGGNYIFKPDELHDYLKLEPAAKKFVRPLVGSEELIKGKRRFILYLRDATPQELAKMPYVMERVRAVREQRAKSSAAATRKTADTPTSFYFDSTTDQRFLVIPSVSSERRRYVPLAMCEPDVVATNLVSIVPGATLYHFGILTSQTHNAWMRMVAGRLKSDYRYAPKVVYNTFPWPDPADARRVEIERCAQAVLDARKLYEGSTLADMYDPDNDFLYPELMRAHRELDAAVEAAYGVDFGGDEEGIVAHLFRLYADKVGDRA